METKVPSLSLLLFPLTTGYSMQMFRLADYDVFPCGLFIDCWHPVDLLVDNDEAMVAIMGNRAIQPNSRHFGYISIHYSNSNMAYRWCIPLTGTLRHSNALTDLAHSTRPRSYNAKEMGPVVEPIIYDDDDDDGDFTMEKRFAFNFAFSICNLQPAS